MRFYRDRPDIITDVVWSFTDRTDFVPYANRFGSSNWDKVKPVDGCPVGELAGPHPWRNGSKPDGLNEGPEPCGTPAQWAGAIDFADALPYPCGCGGLALRGCQCLSGQGAFNGMRVYVGVGCQCQTSDSEDITTGGCQCQIGVGFLTFSAGCQCQVGTGFNWSITGSGCQCQVGTQGTPLVGFGCQCQAGTQGTPLVGFGCQCQAGTQGTPTVGEGCQCQESQSGIKPQELELSVGMIAMQGGSALPSGWLFCDGSVVSQATYADLYAVIGNTWDTGGEGAGNFRLPDLRGRAPIGVGTGSGLTPRALADVGGEEEHTLTIAEMPSHSHELDWDLSTQFGSNQSTIKSPPRANSANSEVAGGDQPHNNMQPFAACNFIIRYLA